MPSGEGGRHVFFAIGDSASERDGRAHVSNERESANACEPQIVAGRMTESAYMFSLHNLRALRIRAASAVRRDKKLSRSMVVCVFRECA